MRPEMKRPGALAGETGWVEGKSLPVDTAENSPDAPEPKSASFGCTASPPLSDIATHINENEAHVRVCHAGSDQNDMLAALGGHGPWSGTTEPDQVPRTPDRSVCNQGTETGPKQYAALTNMGRTNNSIWMV
jgi:hypothetical protein